MSEDQDEPQDVPSAYTREDLVHLDTIDAIRMRPRMYLGHDDQRALLNFLMCGATPGLENAIHRFASYVTVTAKVDGEFTVFDNGPGYGTVSVHEDDQTGTEMLLTRIDHAYSPYMETDDPPQVIPTLGPVCTTALSEYLIYETARLGMIWRQRFEKGRPVSNSEAVGEDEAQWQRITFKPDRQILGDLQLSTSHLVEWFGDLSVSFHEAKITLHDERVGKTIILNG